MTDQSGHPDDNHERPGSDQQPAAGDPSQSSDERSESVLSGFSWDDPQGAAPTRPEDDDPSASTPQGDQTPAQYPPPAPYPPATSSEPGRSEPHGQSEPYGQPQSDQPPYGQPQSGAGYGQSAPYASTPQPYAYGPPPLSPEGEKARSNAILWTILNGVSIFLCGNLLAIGGVILAALAIGKAREDVNGSRNLTKWSWILFAAGFVIGLLLLIGWALLFGFAIFNSGMSSEF